MANEEMKEGIWYGDIIGKKDAILYRLRQEGWKKADGENGKRHSVPRLVNDATIRVELGTNNFESELDLQQVVNKLVTFMRENFNAPTEEELALVAEGVSVGEVKLLCEQYTKSFKLASEAYDKGFRDGQRAATV